MSAPRAVHGRVRVPDLAGGLRRRYRLRLHGLCIGTLVLLVMLLAAWVQRLAGGESLALRYFVTLGLGYVAFLLILRVWAGALVRRESSIDAPDPGLGGGGGGGKGGASEGAPGGGIRSGQGGEFGGGGASADYGAASDSAGELAGEAAQGTLELAAGADEAAVLLVPLVLVFLGLALVVFGAGSLLMLYFGWEALLAVAVELAFAWASARGAVRIARAGWLPAVLRLTWKPLLGALASGVALGALIDHFVPAARSLPHAVRLVLG